MKHDIHNDPAETDASFDPAMMLYVAGELDPAGRSAFETRLASDETLREILAGLSATDVALRADASTREISAADSRLALMGSIRLVREQALMLSNRPVSDSRKGRLLNLPRWAWGSAVAALLAVGFVVWVSNSEPSVPTVIAQTAPLSNEGDNPTLGSGFARIQPEMTEDVGSEIDNQVDALNLLATMTDRN